MVNRETMLELRSESRLNALIFITTELFGIQTSDTVSGILSVNTRLPQWFSLLYTERREGISL